ncbi:hypothetical protein [Escherichia coli]|uniref:hypothetical protein n=1 Tax=Escherichia coli TaxID=562 RepID=UPI0020231A74|nr:hypothetical protein [Escherichia coli]
MDYPGNNSLIVSAPDELLPVLSDFINSVDVARDQVILLRTSVRYRQQFRLRMARRSYLVG